MKWTDKIRNELWRITQEKSIENQMKKKKKMELDWTYIKQRNRSSRENHIRLESTGV